MERLRVNKLRRVSIHIGPIGKHTLTAALHKGFAVHAPRGSLVGACGAARRGPL